MVINFPRTFIHTRKLWKFLFNWYYIILKTRLLQSSLRSIFRAIIFWDFKSRSLSEIFTSSWQDNLFSWSHVFTIKPVDNLPDFSKFAHATRSLNMKIVFVLSGHILIYSQTKDWELHFSIKKTDGWPSNSQKLPLPFKDLCHLCDWFSITTAVFENNETRTV